MCKIKITLLLLLITLLGLSACQTRQVLGIDNPEANSPNANPLELPQKPTAVSPMSPSPTPTAEPVQVTASVYQSLPEVPIVMYHRFNPGTGGTSEQYKTSLDDFVNHLQAFYDAGYSLVALDDWLRGELNLQEGRKPLIITIDDLFYADQISLDSNGEPAPYSGIGRLWQFYQDHPDFNFHLALFYNLGDKGYANRYSGGNFFIEDDWRKDRAEAVAWCIQNNAIPYNHFHDHPNLKYLSPDEILSQLEVNEAALRESLDLIGKRELAENLPNILALPYVIWPETEAGKQVIYDYQTPEGARVLAVLEANDGDYVRPLPAPFAETFDPYHVKRLNAIQDAVDAIVAKADEIPPAIKCDLGRLPAESLLNPSQITLAILNQTTQGNCPDGYYSVGGFAFFVDADNTIQLLP